MEGRLGVSCSVCLMGHHKWDLFPSSNSVSNLKQSQTAYNGQAILPKYMSHIPGLNSYFILLSTRWIMISILWPIAHEFNPTSNNTLAVSSLYQEHAHMSSVSAGLWSWLILIWNQRVVALCKRTIFVATSSWVIQNFAPKCIIRVKWSNSILTLRLK